MSSPSDGGVGALQSAAPEELRRQALAGLLDLASRPRLLGDARLALCRAMYRYWSQAGETELAALASYLRLEAEEMSAPNEGAAAGPAASPEEVRRQLLNSLDRLLSHTWVLSHDELAMGRAQRSFWLNADTQTLTALGTLLDRERYRSEGEA